jgi:ribose transport system substrate-binding protein
VAPEGIQYAYRVAKGEPVPGEILLDVQGVNADNIDDFLGKGF